jgi:hypothetical protein
VKEQFGTKVEAMLNPWKELITPLECSSPPLMIDLTISQHLRAPILVWRLLHGEDILSDGHSQMWTTSTLGGFGYSIVKQPVL